MRYLKGVLFICSLVVAATANAGHYDIAYSGGSASAVGWSGTTNSPSYGLSNGKWGGLTSSVVNPSNQASETAKSVSYSGQITATFTWVPDVPNEPTPTVVLLTQECTASWSGETGSASTGLPNEQVTSGLNSATATAKKVTAKSSPGVSFTVQCSPSASGACTPNGLVLAASAGVAYSASAEVPIILLDGTVEDNGKHYCLVGQAVEARVNLSQASGVTIVYSWTPPADSFKNFFVSVDQTQGKVIDLTEAEKLNPSISFAFKGEEGAKTVTCNLQVTTEGQTTAITLSKLISVESVKVKSSTIDLAPCSSYLGNHPGIKTGMEAGNLLDTIDWSNYGGRACFLGGIVGYKQTVEVHGIPARYASQGGGNIHFVQLLSGQTTITYFAGPPSVTVIGSETLDNSYPYSSGSNVSQSGGAVMMNDTPQLSAGGSAESLIDLGDYEPYVMFIPPNNGKGTQAVNLWRAKWRWHGDCSRSAPNTDLSPTYNPNGDPEYSENSEYFTHPKWSHKFTNTGGGNSPGDGPGGPP